MSAVDYVAMGLLALAGLAAPTRAQEIGFDTGADLSSFDVKSMEQAADNLGFNGWLRLRGAPDPAVTSEAELSRARAALGALRKRGWKICVLLSQPAAVGFVTSAPARDGYLPADLRFAELRLRKLTNAYRGLVDAWEIENEPDVGFVPENAEAYAAYLKACYLGSHHPLGSGETAAGPLVLMAPLAMPPGPYLERLIANGLLGYTDGFNYHYYGYADDFSAVYRQFESAVQPDRGRPHGAKKELPVFLTECGYGMLGIQAATTVEGRVNQWRWFSSVADQVAEVRPEAALMFLLRPYAELGLNEFGLEMPLSNSWSFTPRNFDLTGPVPWMARIGERIGEGRISPALAYLESDGAWQGYDPKRWVVNAPVPSPIVIDFRPRREMRATKSFQGYALSEGEEGPLESGNGELRIYNFSDHPISGKLHFAGSVEASFEGMGKSTLRIAAGQLQIVPIHLAVRRTPWRGHPWTVTFGPAVGGGDAVFSTIFYPDWSHASPAVAADFRFTAEQAIRQKKALCLQPLAEEEPEIEEKGRWLVTHGVEVQEKQGLFIFTIQSLPSTSLRPAVAELPLPDQFTIPKDSLARFDLRCESAGSILARYAGLSTAKGGVMQIQFRTANGNLYEVWPRRALDAGWQTYEEAADNFTMSFFGRAHLPWRFRDNQPVALVFTFWPRSLPTTVEVRPIGFVRLGPSNPTSP